MNVKYNPIFQLKQKVEDGKIAFKEALNIAVSAKFIDKIDRNHCKDILEYIKNPILPITEPNLNLSWLNLYCSSKINMTISFNAEANLFHAHLLQMLGNSFDSLLFLKIARTLYWKTKMLKEIDQCEYYILILEKILGDNEKINDTIFAMKMKLNELLPDYLFAHCEMSLAKFYSIGGQAKIAINHFLSAQKSYSRLNLLYDLANCEMELGILYADKDEYQLAIKYLVSASDRFKKESAISHQAACFFTLTKLSIDKNEYDNAIYFYETLRSILSIDEDPKGIADLDIAITNYLLENGYYKKAIKNLNFILKYYSKSNDINLIAGCESDLGTTHAKLGNFQLALKHFDKAKSFFKKTKEDYYLAGCLMNIANVYTNLNEDQIAITTFKQARGILKNIGSDFDVARCEMNMASSVFNLGDYNHALKLYKNAKMVFKEISRYDKVAIIEANIGNIFDNIGDLNNSINQYSLASSIYEKLGDEERKVRCNVNLSLVLMKIGQVVIAKNMLVSAKEFFTDRSMKIDIADCNRNIGIIEANKENVESAIKYFEDAKKIFLEENMIAEAAICDSNLAITFSKKGYNKKGVDLSTQAREIFYKKDMRFEIANCELNIANSLIHDGQLETAVRYLHQIEKDYNQLKKIMYNCFWLMARAYNILGNYEQATCYYRKSIDIIEFIRGDLQISDFRVSLLGTAFDLYSEIINLYFCQSNFVAALGYVERLKSRELNDMIGQREYITKNIPEEQLKECRNLQSTISAITSLLFQETNHKRIIKLNNQLEIEIKKYEEFVSFLDKTDINFRTGNKKKDAYKEICNLIGDSSTIIIELFPMTDKTIVFLIRMEKKIEAISVDYTINFLSEDIREYLIKYNSI